MPRPYSKRPTIFDETGTRHPFAGRVRFCALIQILIIGGIYLGIPAYLVLTMWFEIHSLHLLWYPGGLILLVFLRQIIGRNTHCCICHQTLFLHQPISKSRNAPRYLPFGVHSTAAFLSLCARSIRCPYCGRVNRLAKD